jgi:hypothetical protein
MNSASTSLAITALIIGVASMRRRSAAIGAVYEDVPKTFYECADGTFSDHSLRRACTWHGGLKEGGKQYFVNDTLNSGGSEALAVFDVPVNDIKIYLEKFQNRKAPYSIESVQRIVDAAQSGQFRFEEFDPVLLWKAPDGKLYMLSGHSRLEAFTRLCKSDKQFCKIPSKIIDVPQAEAEEIALRSNTLSTKERDTERAIFYRNLILSGNTYRAVLEIAKKNEGKDAARIVSYSALDPNGKTFTAMQALENGDPTSQQIIKAVAQWIGEARMKFPMLSNMHEDEIYDWLINGAFGNQYKRKDDFLNKIATVIHQRTEFGVFDPERPLNLLNAATKSFSENQFDQMELDLRHRIKEQEGIIATKTKDYRDRGASTQQIMDLLANDNALLSRLRIEWAQLASKKSDVLSQSRNELNLFAVSGHRRQAAIGCFL